MRRSFSEGGPSGRYKRRLIGQPFDALRLLTEVGSGPGKQCVGSTRVCAVGSKNTTMVIRRTQLNSPLASCRLLRLHKEKDSNRI